MAPPKAHEVRIQIIHTGVCHTGKTSDDLWILIIRHTVLLGWVSLTDHSHRPQTRIRSRVRIRRGHFLSSLVMKAPVSSNQSVKGLPPSSPAIASSLSSKPWNRLDLRVVDANCLPKALPNVGSVSFAGPEKPTSAKKFALPRAEA